MMVVAVFLSIFNQMDFHLVKGRGRVCRCGHVSFCVGGDGDMVYSMWRPKCRHWLPLEVLYFDSEGLFQRVSKHK